jgi:hypothetical protein
MSLEINHGQAAFAFAQACRRQIRADGTFDGEKTMTMTKTLMATCAVKRLQNKIPGKPAPAYNAATSQVLNVPASEIEAAQLVAREGGWTFDQNYRVLIIPAGDEERLRDSILRMRKGTAERICMYLCPDANEDDVLPELLFVYNQDGSVEEHTLCRQCIILTLQDTVAFFFNPNTHLIDREKMISMGEKPAALPTVPSEHVEGIDQNWPSVPLAQIVWAMMSERKVLDAYVKAWMTATIEYFFRAQKNMITMCPEHPDIILRTPAAGESMKCTQCNQFLCGVCSAWHDMNDPCQMGDIPGTRRCPNCRKPVFKISGCNSVLCSCGKCFCWKCGAGPFADAHPHCLEVHGSYWN